jgi:hypothetical protein
MEAASMVRLWRLWSSLDFQTGVIVGSLSYNCIIFIGFTLESLRNDSATWLISLPIAILSATAAGFWLLKHPAMAKKPEAGN